MIKKNSATPLYIQLVETLMNTITQKMQPNDKMMSEREICQIYDVSRTTVRLALAELENSGYIYKRHGRGTFVSGALKERKNLMDNYSFTDHMRQLNKEPKTIVVTFEIDAVNPMVAKQMGLKEGEMIVIRVIKRQDKNRKRIKQYPIYLTGKTALKYRWEYLSEYYDTDNSINDIDIPCTHATIDLKTLQSEYILTDYADELNELEIASNEPNEVESQDETEPVQKESDVFASETKKNNIANRQQKRKEEQLNKKINEHVKVSEVIQKGVLLQAFDGDIEKVNEYSEMGIVEFRDIVISNDKEISDRMCSIMLSKIDTAIKQIEKDIEKENI